MSDRGILINLKRTKGNHDLRKMEPKNLTEYVHVLLQTLEKWHPGLYMSHPDEDLEVLTKLLKHTYPSEILEEYMTTDVGRGILIGSLTTLYEIQQEAVQAADEEGWE